MLTNDSRIVWKVLNGVICIYKPAEVTSNQIRKTLMSKISTGIYTYRKYISKMTKSLSIDKVYSQLKILGTN